MNRDDALLSEVQRLLDAQVEYRKEHLELLRKLYARVIAIESLNTDLEKIATVTQTAVQSLNLRVNLLFGCVAFLAFIFVLALIFGGRG